MDLDEALKIVRAAGYRASKPKVKTVFAGGLNAVGKPYGANFDPNYKIRTPLTAISRLLRPMPRNTPWVK